MIIVDSIRKAIGHKPTRPRHEPTLLSLPNLEARLSIVLDSENIVIKLLNIAIVGRPTTTAASHAVRTTQVLVIMTSNYGPYFVDNRFLFSLILAEQDTGILETGTWDVPAVVAVRVRAVPLP